MYVDVDDNDTLNPFMIILPQLFSGRKTNVSEN